MLEALKKYFGYSEFRPLQEETIKTVVAGRDAFLLMPTGGGKSLCYQLPAVLLDGLTVVVSPLIALMKDQVDQLNALGIPATFLNSSLEASETEDRVRKLKRGEYKLLYVAPERLVMTGFLGFLDRLNVRLFAIDEAHCISEWGHDFRAEYRQLSIIKKRWPKVPLIAMTATATKRVEKDILTELGLRDPHRAQASFNRPNLAYTVRPKVKHFKELLDFLKQHKGDSGIIYCFSRNGAEELATALKTEGFRALPYHAGLDQQTRIRNQEKFSRDKVEIICATIAFGMGINKSNVRFVVHYDLPKSLAGYYQETGRAGRDGLPADCLLFFGLGDQTKQIIFIEEKPTEAERVHAREELDRMVAYAQSRICRRVALLGYFHEVFEGVPCGACDNCLVSGSQDMFDATREAQMFLSCMMRVQQSFGAGHIIEILRGSESEKIFNWRHNKLSTYGIGKSHSADEWKWIAAELQRLEYIRPDHNHHSVLRLMPKGADVLKGKTKVSIYYSPKRPKAQREKEGALAAPNESLFQELRELRKRIAEHQSVPPYVVFSDLSLKQMSSIIPLDVPALLKISGVGETKAERYGTEFLTVIRQYANENPNLEPIEPPKMPMIAEMDGATETARVTAKMMRDGLTPKQVAKERDLTLSTVEAHLALAVADGFADLMPRLVSEPRRALLQAAFESIGWEVLKPVMEHLVEKYPENKFEYAELRYVRSYHIAEQKQNGEVDLSAKSSHVTS
jgi:ATP-dependent DNA helicase RecQ